MMELITGGGTGLLLGMGLQLCGLSLRENVTGMLAFSRRRVLRAALGAIGLGVMLTAFLAWLAVIDVDYLTVLPLDGGTVIGGAVFGLTMGLTGFTPAAALTGIGGSRLLESLCCVIGCGAGALLLPSLSPLFDRARALIPAMDGTWFRVKLEGPYLFAGGFLGLGCIGLVLSVLALCIRPEHAVTAEAPLPPDHAPDPTPEAAAEDAFTAILPGEEPLVVDTEPVPAPEASPDDETEAAPETDEPGKEDVPMDKESPDTEEAPLLRDHPELEDPAAPEADSLADDIRERETGAGMVTPSQQAALPADARVIDKTPPEAAKAAPEDQDEAQREGREQG